MCGIEVFHIRANRTIYMAIYERGFMSMFVKNNDLRKYQWIQMNDFHFDKGKAFIMCLCLLCVRAYGNSRIALEKTHVDLGALETSQKVHLERLHFKNEGDDRLEIRYTGSSCGCTRIVEMQDKVEPGDTGYILIEVDPSKAGSGSSSQSLFLETNDPNHKGLAIKVFYRTKLAEVELFPKQMNLQLTTTQVRGQQGNVKNSFYILDTWPGRLRILDINTSKYARTALDDIVHRCERGAETHILRFDTRLTEDLPIGIFEEWIKVKTNHPAYSEIVIRITGRVQSGIVVSPKMIILNKRNKTIVLRCSVGNKEEEIEILQIRAEAPWLEIKKREGDTPKVSEYSVSVNEKYIEKHERQFLKAELCIEFGKPEKEERTVQVLYHGF